VVQVGSVAEEQPLGTFFGKRDASFSLWTLELVLGHTSAISFMLTRE
jgi:hypothetical protein